MGEPFRLLVTGSRDWFDYDVIRAEIGMVVTKYGKDAQERHGPDLTDEHIAELARKRDETRARTLARFGLLET